MASPKATTQEPKMSVLRSKDIAKPSLTNYYQVNIGGIPSEVKKYIAKIYGVPSNWISEQAGLMCADATLPTSSFATAEVKDNFHGINQQFAHTRLYIDSDFTFYVDKNYQMIKVFEGWMDYISGNNLNLSGGITRESALYYRRFNYPEGPTGYKCQSGFNIIKFERDTNKVNAPMLTYQFFNVFPKSMSAIPVSYGPADVLKVTVSFTYDRYFIEQGRGEGESGSGSKGEDTTGQGLQSVNRQPQPESERYTAEELEAERQRSYNESIAAGRSNRNRNSGVRGPRER